MGSSVGFSEFVSRGNGTLLGDTAEGQGIRDVIKGTVTSMVKLVNEIGWHAVLFTTLEMGVNYYRLFLSILNPALLGIWRTILRTLSFTLHWMSIIFLFVGLTSTFLRWLLVEIHLFFMGRDIFCFIALPFYAGKTLTDSVLSYSSDFGTIKGKLGLSEWLDGEEIVGMLTMFGRILFDLFVVAGTGIGVTAGFLSVMMILAPLINAMWEFELDHHQLHITIDGVLHVVRFRVGRYFIVTVCIGAFIMAPIALICSVLASIPFQIIIKCIIFLWVCLCIAFLLAIIVLKIILLLTSNYST